MAACNTCNHGPPEVTLKRCAKCSTTQYCSRDCQKIDWKNHRKICGKQAGQTSGGTGDTRSSTAGSPPKGLDKPINSPFTRLDNGTWLHDRPEVDVYRLLIESYRMRMEDDYNIDGDPDADSIYAGAPNGQAGFRRYLKKVSSKPGILPPWWNAEHKAKCEKLGKPGGEKWYDLGCAIEKSDIIENYGDPQFPMQLRMFTESILGDAPGGADGTATRKMLASFENGTGPEGAHRMMIDQTTGNTTRYT